MLKAALKSSAGIQSVAAEKLGTTRANISQRISSSTELQDWLVEIDQAILDGAEAVIVTSMQEKRPDAPTKPTAEALRTAKWWAERKGKDRGFSTRQQLTDGDDQPLAAAQVNINVRYVDAPPQQEDVV